MKKTYVIPTVEKVEFQYDKVVAASIPQGVVGYWENTDQCVGQKVRVGAPDSCISN